MFERESAIVANRNAIIDASFEKVAYQGRVYRYCRCELKVVGETRSL